MNRVFRLFTFCLVVTLLVIFSACSHPSPSHGSPGNSNASANTSASTSGSGPAASLKTGAISVDSKPAGAAVLLLETDEGGASPPQPRGTTPTTIDRLEPGKYTIHLEMKGYKAFQKEVEVKAGATVAVVGHLKK